MQQEIPTDNVVFGTCKIKDGLYIGDQYAAKDLEFVVLNKVGYIINSVNAFMENNWESMGVVYMSFQFLEGDVPRRDMIEQMYNFIEECAASGQSCLIHSINGQSRACSLAAIYLMRRFKWSLYKSLEYLNSRRSDLEIKTSFFQVLSQVEQILQYEFVLAQTWDLQLLLMIEFKRSKVPEDEQLIVYTFLNSKQVGIDSIYTQAEEFKKMLLRDQKTKLIWLEQSEKKETPTMKHLYKSIMKGSKRIFVKTYSGEGDNHKQFHKHNISVIQSPLFNEDKENVQSIQQSKRQQPIRPSSAETEVYKTPQTNKKINSQYTEEVQKNHSQQLEDIKKLLGKQVCGLLEPNEKMDDLSRYANQQNQPQKQNYMKQNLTKNQSLNIPLKEYSQSVQNIKAQPTNVQAQQVHTQAQAVNMSVYRKKENTKQMQQKRSISNPRKCPTLSKNSIHNSMNQVASPLIILRPKMANFDVPMDRNNQVSHLFDQFQIIQSQKELIKQKINRR